jgi:hypothetical protein
MSVTGEGQQQLIKRIGRALLGAAPQDWQQIRAEYRSAGRHIEADVLVTGADGQPQPIRPPMEVVELLGELRAAMYQPGRGTWMSGVYLLDHPSKYSADFAPDTEPRWRRMPPPIGFQDELRRFPRDEAHIPEWLRMRAGLPPAADSAGAQATPTPPGGFAAPAHQSTSTPPGGFAQPPAAGQHSGFAEPPSQAPTATPPGGFTPPAHQAAATPSGGFAQSQGQPGDGFGQPPTATPGGGFPRPPQPPALAPSGGLPRPPGPRDAPLGGLPMPPPPAGFVEPPAPYGH